MVSNGNNNGVDVFWSLFLSALVVNRATAAIFPLQKNHQLSLQQREFLSRENGHVIFDELKLCYFSMMMYGR